MVNTNVLLFLNFFRLLIVNLNVLDKTLKVIRGVQLERFFRAPGLRSNYLSAFFR